MELQYRIKSVYGRDVMYLVADGPGGGEEHLKIMAVHKLTGRKSLTDSDKAALEALGFSFTQVI